MTDFQQDYLVWVFVSAIGVFQAAAAWSGLSGLLFLRPWPRANLWLAVVVVILAYAWYFASGNRNQPDTGLGLDGNRQALYSFLSIGAALVVTLVMSSLLNDAWARRSGWEGPDRWPPAGLDRLRRTTFLRALAARASDLVRRR